MDAIVFNVVCSLLVALIGYFVRVIYENRRQLYLLCVSKIKPNAEIRISAAYLFRIEVDGKYLLIRGHRIMQYQPVGGVYKRFESSRDYLDRLEVHRDNSMKSTTEDPSDLRIAIPRKNVLGFIKWFDGGTGRETQVAREFKEELIDGGFLPVESLATFNPEFVRRSDRRVRISSYLGVPELLMFDIYDARLGEAYSEKLASYVAMNPGGALALVDVEEISHCQTWIGETSYCIGAHTKWVV